MEYLFMYQSDMYYCYQLMIGNYIYRYNMVYKIFNYLIAVIYKYKPILGYTNLQSIPIQPIYQFPILFP
jgi:hypothetical protein